MCDVIVNDFFYFSPQVMVAVMIMWHNKIQVIDIQLQLGCHMILWEL